MILVSKIFLVPIGCLQGAQEALDLPLAVAVTGSGLGPSGSLLGVQKSSPYLFLYPKAPVGGCGFLLPFSWCNFKPPYRTWFANNEAIYQNAAVLQHFWAKSIQ